MGAKTFVVVGGTSGLGLAVARLLVNEHQVVVFGNVAAEVAATTDQLGCAGALCDVSSYEQVRDAFAEVVQRYGTIDGVTDCASMWAGGDLADLAVEHIRRAIEINVLGTTYLLREALEHLRRQGHGNVVYIGALALAAPGPASRCTGRPRATAAASSSHWRRLSTATGSR
ncbi:hypothetical protein GCM10027614_72570 [Micromonospora vulcania]